MRFDLIHQGHTVSGAGPIGDRAGRDRPIALLGKQLQQALIADAVRQTSYVKLCDLLACVLIGSSARHARKTKLDSREHPWACYAVYALSAFGCVVRSLWFGKLI